MNVDDVEEARFQIRKVIVTAGGDLGAIVGPWAREDTRLVELYYALLVAVSDVDEFALHDLIERMHAMQLLDPASLAALDDTSLETNEQAGRLRSVMIEDGVSLAAASRAVRAWVAVSRALVKQYEGRVQRYLRQYGERMLDEASTVFGGTALADSELRTAFTLWLQNCLNMPLSLVDDAVGAFCESREITTDALIEAADSLDLNLAVLDDLLRLEAEASGDGNTTDDVDGQSVDAELDVVERE